MLEGVFFFLSPELVLSSINNDRVCHPRYGASDALHVVGGLTIRPLAEVCAAVAAMGFTVVRLPFSSEMLRLGTAAVTPRAVDFGLNPALRGKTPLEVLDAVVDGLGAAKVAVVLNNHTTLGMWSGGVEANGLWFQEAEKDGSGGGEGGGGGTYTEARWVADWVMLARRYQGRPWVVGYDLRNEVRAVTKIK